MHVDTGINRVGLTPSEFAVVARDRERLAAFSPCLVMSHLAHGDAPDDPANIEQCNVFAELRALLPTVPASLANSPGSLMGADFAFDMIRPGVALYGGNPFCDRPNPMKPVARLDARILQIRHLEAGTGVGYGATWCARRPSTIAVIGVGYRDGYARSLSFPANDGPAQVAIGGHLAPVVGRVSMDMITVDVTDLPAGIAYRGAAAELFGHTIAIDDLARWVGTITYEILTGLGSRFARVYSPIDSPEPDSPGHQDQDINN